MDVAAMASAVALVAGTGAVQGLGESAALSLVAKIRERIRIVFGGDPRSADALERAVATPEDESALHELAEALRWYAERDRAFADEMAEWARQTASSGKFVQNVRAGRDAYTAGRDMTVQQRPDAKPSPDD
ncbi:hypothetical protein AB0K05_16155 [Nonomuraea sp. NPDC049486]|uniref:hypothetical protein n=1 Tax=Nonomuraea sp. NPDC049486 TaxID=3155773 RepID=UPI00342E84EA